MAVNKSVATFIVHIRSSRPSYLGAEPDIFSPNIRLFITALKRISNDTVHWHKKIKNMYK